MKFVILKVFQNLSSAACTLEDWGKREASPGNLTLTRLLYKFQGFIKNRGFLPFFCAGAPPC